MKAINVLSLFDGMSCGRVALERAGIVIKNYFASEIDKYAIQISRKNYPDIIHLGDVNNWTNWNLPKIDLIIGGSPCQGFSIAGKQLNFDDPRSELFFKFIDILRYYDPKWFLLENVKMKKEYENVITEYMFVTPIEINSALVSAQNRKRLYWTNIPNVRCPEDRKIFLRDILEDNADIKYCVDKSKTVRTSGRGSGINDKHNWDTIRVGIIGKGGQGQRIYSPEGKSVALSALGGGQGAKTGLYDINYQIRKLTPVECERLQTLPDNYTKYLDIKKYNMYIGQEIKNGGIKCLKKYVKLRDAQEKPELINTGNSVFYITKDLFDMEVLSYLKKSLNQKKNVNIVIERLGKKEAEPEECVIDITKIGYDTETLYSQIKNILNLESMGITNQINIKLPTTGKYMKIILEESSKKMKLFIILILIKLITVLEIYIYVEHEVNIYFCIDNLKILQENFIELELSDLKMESIILNSDTQRYKMLGNGWTVDVIAHILQGIK